MITYHESGLFNFKAGIDLSDGSVQTQVNGLATPTVVVAPDGNAFRVTIYFVSSGLGSWADLGFAPWRGTISSDVLSQGDFVYGTAAKWYAIDQFCAP